VFNGCSNAQRYKRKIAAMNFENNVSVTRKQLDDSGVEYCFAAFVDVHGIPKAKAVPIQSFEKMCRGSELFTVGALEGLGLVGPHEDECAAIPDLNSMIIFPWDHRHPWFASNLHYHGVSYEACSRVILKRVMEKAKRMGFVFNLGIEAEFYVLRQEGSEYRPIVEVPFAGICPSYDLYQTTQSMSFLDPMVKFMNQLGWGVFSFDKEGGMGQYELDFYHADALTIADRLIFLRFMAKNVAQSIGAIATFMPKPFSHDFRSAAHFNMSLADHKTGQNLFESDSNNDYDLPVSQLCLHFVAGLLQHAPALTAISCPTYNSYQGLLSQGDMQDISWAPILQAYGRNNRSAMLRMPMNRACIENRAPDISCNPYLTAAFSLAAGLEGIEKKLDPGVPLSGNLYEWSAEALKQKQINRLPHTLMDALKAFEVDSLVVEVFGKTFQTVYLNQKMKEWEKGFYKVSEENRSAMLTFI
jgi:glutamine synthetase